MSSIGEYIRWEIPVSCSSCGSDPATWKTEPQPQLRLKIKCENCNRVRTLSPQLTERGLEEATQQFIQKLVK